MKLLFLGILGKDRLEKAYGLLVRVTLQGFEATFVQRDRLEIGGSPLRSGLSRFRRPRSGGRRRRTDVDRSSRTSGSGLGWGFRRTGDRPLLGHKRRESAIKSRLKAAGKVTEPLGRVKRGSDRSGRSRYSRLYTRFLGGLNRLVHLVRREPVLPGDNIDGFPLCQPIDDSHMTNFSGQFCAGREGWLR